MRKALLFLIFIVITISCETNDGGYVIKGVIKGEDITLKDGIVYIQRANTKSAFDSTQIRKGRFTFKGKLQMPDKYMIFMKELNYNIPIYLENKEFRVEAFSDNLREATVAGGLNQELSNKTTLKSRSVMKKYNLNHILGELMKAELSAELRSQYSSVVNRANGEMKNFIDSIVTAYPTSFYSLLNLNELVNIGNIKELEKRVESFEKSGEFQGNSYLIKIRETIEKRKLLEPGMVAPDFTLLSLDESPVTFSKIYGNNKFTLLIFWSSWSGESTQFCKDIGVNYNLYRNNGIEMVAVTIGDVERNWRDKIQNENFSWIQLKDSELSDVSSVYNVQLIPHVILVDTEGKIIMNNNPVGEIIDYLADILDNK
ncbi:MAG: TlpA disulfide reductase family protein [Bacteroidales bacterium]|nr:TlpA disulfide reductase family protein [Bacteroidales bacterium]